MKHILVYGMTDNPGGIETYLINMFQRVQGKGVMMDFICDFPSIAYEDVLKRKNAKIYFFPAKSADLWKHLKTLWKVLREHKEYQTVYFNILDAGAAVTMLVPFLLGRRIVVHSHNSSTDKEKLHKLCKPFLKFMAKGRVACSKSAAQYMFDTIKNVQIVPNAIDGHKYEFNPEVRNLKRKELGIKDDELAVCHVGRISYQKNPKGLVDIFEAVHAKNPNSVLLSVGTGEMMEEYQAYIAEKHMGEAIRCLGVRSDIDEILQAADVFLFPSFFEGLPIAALEAQAAGLPSFFSDSISDEVIITDVAQRISLKKSPEYWAERILETSRQERKSTLNQIIKAGFDLSCCERSDKKLIRKFK